MRYLGGIRGNGVLSLDGRALARADYDFDGYLSRQGEVTGSGEIRTTREALRGSFGLKGLRLQTEDGRSFSLRYTERQLKAEAVSAHVDVVGDLPKQQEWAV